MKYVNVENFSDLVDSKVILSNHNNCTGTIEKYENEKFYVRYESGNTLKQYSTEDFKEGHIVLDDKEKENAVLLKIRLSELKKDVSPMLTMEVHDEQAQKSNPMIVLEQWKMTIESAMSVSTRRQSISNIFTAILTMLIGGVLFSDGLSSTNKSFQLIVSIVISILGLLICCEWKKQIGYYGELNDVKYSAIRSMEKYLPFAVMTAEDIYFYSNYEESKSFSKRESKIPFYFQIAFAAIAIVASLFLIVSLCKPNNTLSNNAKTNSTVNSSVATTGITSSANE